jgi:hypothetical protein
VVANGVVVIANGVVVVANGVVVIANGVVVIATQILALSRRDVIARAWWARESMTLDEQGDRLRAEIKAMEAGSARRYGRAQRRRILKWVERAVRSGMSERECSVQLGISSKRLAKWRAKEAAPTKRLIEIEVEDDASSRSSMSFVSPTGFWIDGLTIEQAITLMRAFA